MLTPQEIAETPLSKVRFGGYDMVEVDDFLERVTEDYSALYKENAILKGKLKVLVEKIEEYRKTEDSMRMALLTAQKVSEDIKTEADKQRESVLRDANEEIKAKLSETAKRVADEELRLSVAAKETSKFIELSQAVIKRHSEFLAKLEAATRVLHETRQYDAKAATAAKASAVNIDDAPTKRIGRKQKTTHGVDDVAAQIDSAVQRMTHSDPVAPIAPPPVAPIAPPPVTPVAPVAPAPVAPVAPVAPIAPVPIAPVAPVAPVVSAPTPADQMPVLQSDTGPLFTQQTLPFYDVDTAPTTPLPVIDELDETSPRPKFDFDDLRFGENF